jgi:hypothetical protein
MFNNMDDRKTRIAKLSERFKPHSGRTKQSIKERERRSYYLDTEIAERLDKTYRDFSHQLYPQIVSKSVFIETVLEYGLDNLKALREIIKTKPENASEKK